MSGEDGVVDESDRWDDPLELRIRLDIALERIAMLEVRSARPLEIAILRPPEANKASDISSQTARNVAKRGRPGTFGMAFEPCDALTCTNANNSARWNNGGNPQGHFGHYSTVKAQVTGILVRRAGL